MDSKQRTRDPIIEKLSKKITFITTCDRNDSSPSFFLSPSPEYSRYSFQLYTFIHNIYTMTRIGFTWRPREKSRGFCRHCSRAPPVCLQTDIFSFGSYWHEGGPRVCTHAGLLLHVMQKVRVSVQTADLFSSLLPPLPLPSFHLDPLMERAGEPGLEFHETRGIIAIGDPRIIALLRVECRGGMKMKFFWRDIVTWPTHNRRFTDFSIS